MCIKGCITHDHLVVTKNTIPILYGNIVSDHVVPIFPMNIKSTYK